MNEVFIVSYGRTPMGSFGGVLSGFSATQLGAIAVQAAIERAKIDPKMVEELVFGNVISANLGQAPARQVAIKSGLANETNCTLVNKVCASGMKSITIAAQNIQMGHTDIAVVGGMESMSSIPYYLPHARWGMKYGGSEIIDGLQKDGLVDAYDNLAMGVYADRTATKYEISREAQDEYTIQSYKRSAQSFANNLIQKEIATITIAQKKADPILVTEDEEYKKVDFSKISSLRPIFTADGTVTAASSSTMNDGASAMVLMSGKKVKELNLKPLARIVSYADAEHEPAWYTTAPATAAPIALKRGGLGLNDIDFFEVNEAFAVVPLTFAKVLNIDPAKMNINGGSISIGHPLGSTGCRIVGTLCSILEQNNASKGLAAICNGGGGATSVVIEKV